MDTYKQYIITLRDSFRGLRVSANKSGSCFKMIRFATFHTWTCCLEERKSKKVEQTCCFWGPIWKLLSEPLMGSYCLWAKCLHKHTQRTSARDRTKWSNPKRSQMSGTGQDCTYSFLVGWGAAVQSAQTIFRAVTWVFVLTLPFHHRLYQTAFIGSVYRPAVALSH